MQAAIRLSESTRVALVPGGGLVAWAAAVVALPAPMVVRVFLLVPMAVVPVVLDALPGRDLVGRRTSDLAPWPALIAATALGGAFAVPAGPAGLALALPWIVLTAACGLAALVHGLPRLRSLFSPRHARELAVDGGLGFLGVGGLFIVADRSGLDLFGFSASAGASLAMLGAVHYHFAGFGLLALIALAAGLAPRLALAAAASLVAGMPLSGLGIFLGQPIVGWLGVAAVGVGGAATTALFLRAAGRTRGARRALLALAAASLLGGVALGVGSATAQLLGIAYLDAGQMARIHGTLNALAVTVAALALATGRGSAARRR